MRHAIAVAGACLSLAATACDYPFGSRQTCSAEAPCPAGASCVDGLCLPCPPCLSSEVCLQARCFAADCAERLCPQGEGCVEGVCVDERCIGVACEAGTACANGICYPSDCALADCSAGAVCLASGCAPLACVGVECAFGEVCANGSCFPADCAGIDCASGAACIDGACRAAACAGVLCPADAACADGVCAPLDCLGASCPAGLACVDGRCADPACVGAQCPMGTLCIGAECIACAAAETSCGDGVDEDCDALIDCADPECLDRTCAADSGCAAHACGSGGQCEARAMSTGAVCRAAVPGGCDLEERCDGTSLTCPDERVEAAGVECRPRAGPCDAHESCDGMSPACPNDLGQTPCTPAVLTISEEPSYDFGTVLVGSTNAHSFTVTNDGGFAATLGEVSSAGLALTAPYSLASGGTCFSGATVAPAASCAFLVEFAPGASGSFPGIIELGYHDGSASQVASRALAGAAVYPALGPSNVTIHADRDLASAALLPGGAIAATGSGLPVGGAPAPATLGGSTIPPSGLPATIETFGLVGPGALAQGTGAAALDCAADWTATVTVDATWPPAAARACEVNAPFASIACAPTSFPVGRAEITTGAPFSIRAYASNGVASDSANSNALATRVYQVRQVSDLAGSTAHDDVWRFMAAYNGKLFFGTPLFAYDPAAQTVTKLGWTDLAFSLTRPVVYRSALHFPGRVDGRYKLLSYDESAGPAALRLVSDTAGSPAQDDAPHRLFVHAGKLFFWSNNPAWVRKLFSYDGASGAVQQVSNTSNDPNSTDDATYDGTPPVEYRGKLYFAARNPNSSGLNHVVKLYAWDDGTRTLAQISNTAADETRTDRPNLDDPPVVLGDTLYFAASDDSGMGGTSLFAYAEAAGTLTRLDASALRQDHSGLTACNGKLFMVGYATWLYLKVHVWDPTARTMRAVSNTVGSVDLSDEPDFLTCVNNELYFVARNPDGRNKLYVWADALSTLTLVSNTSGAPTLDDFPAGADPHFAAYNGKLFFRANNPNGAAKLYLYDPSNGRLDQVTDLRGAGASDTDWNSIVEPVVFADRVGFVAYNTAGFLKVYSLCDPSAGCTAP